MEELDPDERLIAKALLPFLGKRLIDWQIEALAASPYVEGLYLVGLQGDDAPFSLPVHHVPVETTADFPDKLVAGLDYLCSLGKQPDLVVVSTCDAPAITTEAINTFLGGLVEAPGFDFVLGVVPEAIVEEAFPHSGRTVARFRDQHVFPGELYALSPRAIRQGYQLIAELNAMRRRINRQAAVISLWPLIRLLARKGRTWQFLVKYLLGRASLADAERMFSTAFQCRTKAIVVSDVGFGMDMDLPQDYERLQAYVAGVAGIPIAE